MAISTTGIPTSASNQPVSAPGTNRRAGETPASKGGSASSGTSGAKAEPATDLQDTIQLSTEAFRLAQTRKSEQQEAKTDQLETIRKLKRDVESESKKVELQTGEDREDSWQLQRNAKLDRLETMVRQGLYKVDPFMLDELAIRLVRMVG